MPAFPHSFPDEDAALAYAIHNQRDRRNMTDADLLRCIQVVDSLKARGGDRRSDTARSKVQDCTFEKSAAKTAEIVGTSPRKVEQARTVLDHADEETRQAVLDGEVSINRAYNETQERRRGEAQASPTRVTFNRTG